MVGERRRYFAAACRWGWANRRIVETRDYASHLCWALANDPVVCTFDPSRIDPGLQRLAPLYPQYAAIAVFDANGDSVPDVPGEPPRDLEQRRHFEQLMVTGQPVVSPVFLDGGNLRIAVHVPVLDEGRAIGSVSLIFTEIVVEVKCRDVEIQVSVTNH